MHVLATAGHVDHGKSTLVRALTGMEPDRYEEERRRGLTIDLGFAWTTLHDPGGGGAPEEVAFVDVPGHERFVATMLAGVGPVPAVVLVVAADSGWMPQSGEHLDALDALGVRHGLLVVTRSDLADPGPATAQARRHLAGTALAGVEDVAVAAPTGAGVDALRAALHRLVARLPTPDPAAPVRLWVDRVFTVRGAGTVVTGTLPAGTLRVGDELAAADGSTLAVRGLHRLGRSAREVTGVARVAVNLRGVAVGDLRRGDALVTPGSARWGEVVDVRLRPTGGGPRNPAGAAARPLPGQLVLHVGAAAVPVHVRPLGNGGAGETARLVLAPPLPLRVGDTGLLRDPGARAVVAGVVVLDPAPPPLRRRGAARERAAVLAGLDALPSAAGELARRGAARREDLRVLGVAGEDVDALAEQLPGRGGLRAGGWLVDPGAARRWREQLGAAVAEHARERPLEPGLPVEAARQRLGVPVLELVGPLAALAAPGQAPLVVRQGRVAPAARPASVLPPDVQAAVAAVLADLGDAPFAAPDADRLRQLGLGPRQLAASVRAGALERVGDGVYLAPGAPERAAQVLAALAQPFTLSQARQAWGTSRRVAVPLLTLLDARGLTVRRPDDTRHLAARR